MKFNLKNRPKLQRTVFTSYKPDVDDWFAGFEKELRKILNDKYTGFAQKETVKEILGEKEA